MTSICVLGDGHDITHVKIFFEYASKFLAKPDISWVTDVTTSIMAVSAETYRGPTPNWHDINIVSGETYDQIYRFARHFDLSKSYIFVVESCANASELNRVFSGIKVIQHVSMFKEVHMYGSEQFTPWTALSWANNNSTSPEYDFFTIIGRQSKLRSHLIDQLLQLDISESLVKYNGNSYASCDSIKTFDQFNYRGPQFNYERFNDAGMTSLLPKIIQPTLYNNFKFEVQCETDTSRSGGWEIQEYHVTEKTLKPLIANKPCLMLGAKGYNNWLNTFGIDLGHGQFDMMYDSIDNDYQRASTMIEQLPNIINNNNISPVDDVYANNLYGLRKLSDFSINNYKKLFDFVQTF